MATCRRKVLEMRRERRIEFNSRDRTGQQHQFCREPGQLGATLSLLEIMGDNRNRVFFSSTRPSTLQLGVWQ
jgi:hypothetical protein